MASTDNGENPRKPAKEILSKMTLSEKLAVNAKVISRNVRRGVVKSLKAHNPDATPPSDLLEPGFTGMSDNESEVDFTEMLRDPEEEARIAKEREQEEEARKKKELEDEARKKKDDDELGSLTPGTAKTARILAHVLGSKFGLGSKRTSSSGSTDESSKKKKQRRSDRVEVDLAVGESSKLTVPEDFLTAWQAGEHLPLSLFTVDSLRLCHTKINSLRTVKNTEDKSGKKLINVDDARFAKENGLDFALWSDAADTMAQWAGTVDDGGVLQRWLVSHFKYVHGLVAKDREEWPLARGFDISMRQEYHMAPFSFSTAFHRSKFLEFERLERKRLSDSNSYSNQQYYTNVSSSSRPGGSSSGPGHGNKSFRERQSGKSASTCLVCGNLGHRGDSCRATKLCGTDKPPFAKHVNGRLVTVKEGNPICAPWNVYGTFKGACGSHPNRAEHSCSFCGSLKHHATSWQCLSKPDSA